MTCKHCGAPLEEGQTVCPACGAAAQNEDMAQEAAEQTAETKHEEIGSEQAQYAPEEAAQGAAEAPQEPEQADDATQAASEAGTASQAEQADAAEETETPAPAEAEAAQESMPEDTQAQEDAPKPRKKRTALFVSITAIVLVIAVAVGFFLHKNAADEPAHKASYLQPDADAFTDQVLDTVVAKCAGNKLTNRVLSYYYWREYYTLLSNYSSSIYSMMNPYDALDAQYVSEDYTWDQMIMDSAMQSYQTCMAAAAAAEKEGYQMAEDEQDYLDNLEQNVTDFALSYGFADVDQYLTEGYGPYSDLASYREYMQAYMTAVSYLSAKTQQITVSEQEVEARYEENEADYISAGLEKDERPMVNVRHILIKPEAVSLQEGDEGYEEAVQQANEAAKQKAEELYAEWQNGERTEESFAALAQTYSEDTGSAANGGLYEEVYPGQMVDSFDAWCFEDGRKAGDSGIVETGHGYHILYFSGVCETSYWYKTIEEDCRREKYSEMVDALLEQYPLKRSLEKAWVYPCNVTQDTAADSEE